MFIVITMGTYCHIASAHNASELNQASTIENAYIKSADIEIETGSESLSIQQGYTVAPLGEIRFTDSAIQVGLHSLLLEIMNENEVGYQLVQALKRKKSAIVWEAARLKSQGDIVLSENIFGYMDKNNHHSGLLALNHNALKYIIIDLTPIEHETPAGSQRAEIKDIMAHEAIHAILPHQKLVRNFQYGRVLNELFTVYYTNQLRAERGIPLRLSYGDPYTAKIERTILQGLANHSIDTSDLIGNLSGQLKKLTKDSFYEPNSIEEYGISPRLISLLKKNNLLQPY